MQINLSDTCFYFTERYYNLVQQNYDSHEMATGIFIRFRNHRLNVSRMDIIDLGHEVGFSALRVFKEICIMTDPETLQWGSTKPNREKIAKVLEISESRVSQNITTLVQKGLLKTTSLRGLYKINERDCNIVLK